MRLRYTASLSLLALVAGVAGTQWGSEQTGRWPGAHRYLAEGGHTVRPVRRPAPAHVRVARAPLRVAPAHARPNRPMVPVRGVLADSAVSAPVAPAPIAEATLVPLSTPSAPVRYQAMREHLSGRVVLRLWVDGQGRVIASVVAESSGDPQLDAHALASVRDWRFAVPADRPQGMSGILPIRIEAQGGSAGARRG